MAYGVNLRAELQDGQIVFHERGTSGRTGWIMIRGSICGEQTLIGSW